MEDKLTEQFKEQFRTELENAFSRGVVAGGVTIAKNILDKINSHKRNMAVAIPEIRKLCNYVIEYAKVKKEGQK